MKKFHVLLLLMFFKNLAQASEGDLSALNLSVGYLAPAFDQKTTDYTLHVPLFDGNNKKVEVITITPSATNATATIEVSGYSDINGTNKKFTYSVTSNTASPNILIRRCILLRVEVKATNIIYSIKVNLAGFAGLNKMVSIGQLARIGPDVAHVSHLKKPCYEWVAGLYNKDGKFERHDELDKSLLEEPSHDYPPDPKNPNDPNKEKRKKNDRQIEVEPTQITVYQLVINKTIKSEVTVYPFTIEDFRNNASKEWKVVVGEDIEYRVAAMPGCTNWHWTLHDGTKWTLQNNTKQSGKDMKIHHSNLANATNEWFGDAFGTVTVSCTSPDGKTTHTVTSTVKDANRKAKVFFDPNLNEDGDENLSPEKPPCWFKFWKEGGVIDDMNHPFVVFAPSNGKHAGLYNCKFEGNQIIEETLTLFPEAFTLHGMTQILKADGKQYKHGSENEYLNGVASVLAHENYHRHVASTWVINNGEGKDKDGIPDNEETNNNDIFPNTDPDLPDKFGLVADGILSEEYKDNADQELRCRIVELLVSPEKIHPEKDWAKHRFNKNWEPDQEK